jgi:hypothetical protein
MSYEGQQGPRYVIGPDGRPILVAPPGPQRQPWQGFGDVVASATRVLGIPHCGGCEQRRQWLNRVLPFRRG